MLENLLEEIPEIITIILVILKNRQIDKLTLNYPRGKY